MPPRIARSSVSNTRTKSSAKRPQLQNRGSAKRNLDAFAIAAEETKDTTKVRKNRLGEVEDDGPRQKRRRVEDEDEEDESDAEEDPRAHRNQRKGAKEDLDLSEGSDSEGHNWKYGQVDDDDDSEIDSDEAFGSSDEERFAGFVFRGSSTIKGKGKAKATASSSRRKQADSEEDEGLDLNEGESEGDDEEDDDSLGEDAVDLATMLDDHPSDFDEHDEGSEDSGSDEESSSGRKNKQGSDYSMSDAEADSGDETGKLAQLQDLVGALHPEDRKARQQKQVDAHEAREASTAGLVSSEKFDIMDILANTSDPTLKQIAKQTGTLPRKSKKDLKLQPALPKRQQDKLDRKAASQKAKETLSRWVDTVKANREAEHLVFPIPDPDAGAQTGRNEILSTQKVPMTDLEGAIQGILQESGLVKNGASAEEKELLAFEELQARTMSLEEAEARRAELRKNRDLLFREEIRARRVGKIKSKAYRRVHRREREKLAQLDRDAFVENGEGSMDEDEKEEHDRKRAEERMSTKHKSSKWAKQMKKSGRSIWDEEARGGVSDMARRNDELRRRIEGKQVVSDEDDLEADSESSDAESDGSAEGRDDRERGDLNRRLDRLDTKQSGGNKLANMDFMLRAEAKQKAKNDEAIALMRRQLNGIEVESESEEEETIGRKIFGPLVNMQNEEELEAPVARGEFEELSDDEVDYDAALEGTAAQAPANGKRPIKATQQISARKVEATLDPSLPSMSSAKSSKPSKKSSPPQTKKDVAISPPSKNDTTLLRGEKHSQPDADGWQTVTYDKTGAESASDSEDDTEPAMTGADVIRNAFFAPDDVEAAFEAEKEELIAEDAPQTTTTSLPGWGSWAGESLSKKDRQRNRKNITTTTTPGLAPSKRKDSKLRNVIINQRRQKATTGFMASSLPFPFTNRAEYERSIRMPIGKEWNVKEVFQEGTKPRVLVRPNAIIKPMERPA